VKNELEIGWNKGIVIRNNESRFLFDPVSKSAINKEDIIFITHSHADHSAGYTSSSIKYSTEDSRRIFENIRNREVHNFRSIELNQALNFDNIEITPINAGHMLGSVQYRVQSPDSSILYTGDINCVNTLITKKADEVECDILIIEATYGQPTYIFPKRETIYTDMIKWSLERLKEGRIPVFRVYGSGKAQELIKIFNTYTNLTVLTHPRIFRVCEAYSERGVNLKNMDISEIESDDVINDHSCIYVNLPTRNSKNFENQAEAVATGWVIKEHFKSMIGFPLSGHADFKQLIQFVKRTKARTVYVYTGFKTGFSNYLNKKLGINAKPIPALPLKRLEDFLS